MRLHHAHDHVGATVQAPPRLAQHRVGLPDTGGGAEVDPQFTATRTVTFPLFIHVISVLSPEGRKSSRR